MHSYARAPGGSRYDRDMSSVRVDSWVWGVRLAKTRSQATTACRAGHVRINDQTAKAAQSVKIGDVVKVRQHGFDKIYRVTGLPTKRGSATEAAKHFDDLTPLPLPREERPAAIIRDRGAGRPTKRERRDIDRLRGRDSAAGTSTGTDVDTDTDTGLGLGFDASINDRAPKRH